MSNQLPITAWLPLSKEETTKRGWDELDVILVTGDAYVDHPSFGMSVIGRILQSMGLKVAIISQPNWQDDLRDFKKFGAPRLFFGVTAGAMDSMVNHYTANLRKRTDDAYTPGGASGFRPDYAVTCYTKILKRLYPEIPVVVGGIEASLRRMAHFDYWSNSLKHSILIESGADLLVYGMGEEPIKEIVSLLLKGVPFSSLTTICQTAVAIKKGAPLPKNKNWSDTNLHSYEVVYKDKLKQAENFRVFEKESNKIEANRLIQEDGDKVVIINPPYPPRDVAEVDKIYELPYTRLPHPRYKKRGTIPAYEMIKFSINLHRGCFGGCSFCTISAHQGKFVISRSHESIIKEVKALVKHPEFKGTISDLGGPSANMYQMKGIDETECLPCERPSCIFPTTCKNLNTDHGPLISILKDVRKIDGVKNAFVGSGIRYDLIFSDTKNGKNYATEVITHHTSGRLKVAPEHTSSRVLKLMRKPPFEVYKKFRKLFDEISKKANKKQEIIPYFITAHPLCELTDMAHLADETNSEGLKLTQIQDFTPTPLTLATEIYYTGVNPYGMQPIYTPKSKEEREKQHRFIFWHKEDNKNFVRNTLTYLKLPEIAKRLFGG